MGGRIKGVRMYDKVAWGFFLLAVVSILFAGLITVFSLKSESYFHRQIIEYGCGQYNSQTGIFEWLEVNNAIPKGQDIPSPD